MRFSEGSQISISEKSIFDQFEVIFFNIYVFPRARVTCSCQHIQWEVFYRKDELSSWSQKKVIEVSAKVLILDFFDYLGPNSKSIFSTYKQNFRKYLVSFLEEVVRNIVFNFQFSIFKKVRRGGASRFARRPFLYSVILASCNLVGRPFVACHACSSVTFHSSR